MNFDVVIIGAGPAGSAAAIELSKRGWKTALLEKSAFPRHKVCGEFFSPGIVPLWEKLGVLEKIKKSGSLTLKETSLYFPGQKKIKLSLTSGNKPAYALSRFSFDRLMLNHANESGSHIFNQTEALKIKEYPDYCLVTIKDAKKTTELKTTYIIITAGRNHRFQKKNSTPQKGKIGFKRHFKSGNLPVGLELFFFPGGYLGLIEIENLEMNLCGILKRQTFKKCGSNFDSLLKEIISIHPELEFRLEKSKPTTPWLSCVTPKGLQGKTTERILWVGDSAYFLEPMIGQGMTVAVASGMLAAESLINHINPGKYFTKRSGKILKSKQTLLNLLEPLGGISARIPQISHAFSRLILKPDRIQKILSTPSL